MSDNPADNQSENTAPNPTPAAVDTATESQLLRKMKGAAKAAATLEAYPFPSLRGLPGVLVGLISLAACYMMYKVVYLGAERGDLIDPDRRVYLILVVAFSVIGSLGLSALVVIVLGRRRKLRKHLPLWTGHSRRRVLVMSIAWTLALVMATRALWALQIGWIAPMLLGFYGLALFAVPTPGRIPTALLALVVSLCAVLAALVPSYGIIWMVAAFGVGHLAFGLVTLLDASGEKGS